MQTGKERSSRSSREGRLGSQAGNAEDGAKLTMIMRGKINSIFPIFTNTHACEKKRERVKSLVAVKVEGKTAGDVFNSANIGAVDSKKKFLDRTVPSEVKCGGGTRDKGINAAATKERLVRVSDA
jgi:hypothetical protein